jgi:periplasmic divalent cation tolerance protein
MNSMMDHASNPKADPLSAPVLAFTTAGSQDEAERLAHLLVEQRLAACVNVVPGLQSVYRWQGAVESASELLLIIKTATHLLGDLERTIAAHHSYDVPELLVVPIQGGSEPYLRWLIENLRSRPLPGDCP